MTEQPKEMTPEIELANAIILGALSNETKIFLIKAADQGNGCRDLPYRFSVEQSTKIFAFIRNMLNDGL